MTIQPALIPIMQEFSVSEISAKIKHIIENGCGYVNIRGEVSGLKIATSGHGYFNLKDQNAILAATCWKPVLAKLPFQLTEGMEIVASGKITSYAGQSKYQLSVDSIQPAGVGALMQLLMQRKAQYEKEGLFEKSRKKPLPFFPKTIGIVTSLTGAVIKDMLHRIRERCPTQVLVWSVTVQGETAAKEIATAIYGFNNMPQEARPNLLIIARGGGSIEDLWAFNEEIVIRAIAASDIPLISAIGHETDFTLADFVADLRAPTPTAAAEFAVPILSDLRLNVEQQFLRLQTILSKLITHHFQLLHSYDSVLSNPRRLVDAKQQRFDELTFSLDEAVSRYLRLIENQLQNTALKILNPKQLLTLKHLQLDHITSRIPERIQVLLSEADNKLNMQASLLNSLNYQNVLKRGFAIIKTEGQVITSAKEITRGQELQITMHDGDIKAKTQ